MTTETPHTAIRLVESACTSCMVCARECPSWCISIGSHPETVTEPGGGRPRTVHVLDDFVLDWALCMYCGICVETCPFDALEWTSDAVAPGRTLLDLAHGIDALG